MAFYRDQEFNSDEGALLRWNQALGGSESCSGGFLQTGIKKCYSRGSSAPTTKRKLAADVPL